MGEWARVKWAEAIQIVEAVDDSNAPPCAPGIAPKAHFEALSEKGQFDAAARYLALALPRYESVVWAMRMLRSEAAKSDMQHGPTLAALDRWIDDPSDANRRAVWNIGQTAPSNSPEQLLATATFMSGGSMAPEDLQPIQPDPSLCGKMTSAAVLTQAYRTSDPAAFLKAAIATGSTLADEGVR